MRKTLLCTLPLLALAACHAKVDISDTDGNSSGGDDVHLSMGDAAGNSTVPGANKVSIDVPGFSANVSLPNVNLGGHIDFDGIKAAPNSKMTGLDASSNGDDDKGGTAKFTFINSDAPGTVIDYYRHAAADAGYGDIVAGNGTLTAKKGDKSFAVNVTPHGAGSQGTITVSGKD